MNQQLAVKGEAAVASVIWPSEVPYHINLAAAVDGIYEAVSLERPINYTYIETQRDRLSYILDKMDGKI